MIKKRLFFKCAVVYVCLWLYRPASAQNKDTVKSVKTNPFTIGGYVDAYYAVYSDSVGKGNYQKFPAISPRSNSFGLNIAQITEQYTSDRIRSTATVHFGDLPTAAWSPVFNFIQEANVGFRITKKFWIDGGFFKTHIGTEALLPKDNITSSVSVITFYEPWWQSGLKFSYSPSDKFQMAIFLENGYNHFVAINNKKALGMVFCYALGDKGSLGYYNYIGDMAPDSSSFTQVRFLNNLVFTYQFCEKFKIIAGVDLISQQHSDLKDSSKTAYVYSGILTIDYKFNHKFGIYGRVESFSDANGFLGDATINTDNQITGYKLMGVTVGAEYKPTENSYIRLEGRSLQMDPTQEIYRTNGANTNKRGEAMVNMGIWF